MRWSRFFFGLLMVGFTAFPYVAMGADACDLTALGKWTIVVAPDAAPAERFAAEEFRALYAQASGVELPILTGPHGAERHVFIGRSPALLAHGVSVDLNALGVEGFRIVAGDGLIAIVGGSPRGTLYGVYTFVEDYLGARFLTADHTYVPKLATGTTIGPIDRKFSPRFLMRWSYYGETNRSPAFAARLRVNTIDGDPKYGGKSGQSLISHTFGNQIPTSKYGKEHPEYFALRDGKRLSEVRDDFAGDGTEPCLTNPDVLRIVSEAVLAELKANPQRENISVSQNDNNKNCQCPKCAAIDEREGTPMGTLLMFVNGVAERVAQEHPKVMVGTLSYWYTRKPPKTIRPRENVQIQLCSIECCVIHPINDPACEKNRAFCADMDAWGKLTSNIFIWNYNTNFSNYLLPCPNLRVIEPNIRYFDSKGAKGVFMQAAGNATGAELSDLRNYVIGNLLWDPSRSASKLMDEFLDLHYGKAAPPIRKFITLVHDHAEQAGVHPNCFGQAKAYAVDESIAQAGLAAFEEAMRLADDDAVRARVEKASICAVRAAIEPVFYTDKPLDPQAAAQHRPMVKRFFELCDKYKLPMAAETVTVDAVRQRLRTAFALQEGEAF